MMSGRTTGLVLPGLWLLVALQGLYASWVPLPLSAICPAVAAAICLALVLGPVPGALLGAWTGLAMDLLPPAGGPLGAWSLILALICAGLGRAGAARAPGPWESMTMVSLGCGAVVLARAGALWFAGVTPPLGVTLAVVGAAILGGLLLAPVFLPAALVICGRAPLRVGSPGGRKSRRRLPLMGTPAQAPGNPRMPA